MKKAAPLRAAFFIYNYKPNHIMSNTDYRLILSLDGGGIRGTIPAYFLYQLEAASGIRIADKFDMIIGTSTGGIMAGGFTIRDNKGKLKYTGEEIFNLYMKEAKNIFYQHHIRYPEKNNIFKRARKLIRTGVDYISDERYNNKPIIDVLKKYFGDKLYGESYQNQVILTTFDMKSNSPHFLKNYFVRDKNMKLWEAVYATSAAPTFFEPYCTEYTGVNKILVDGGVFANDPAMCAYTEAKKIYPNEKFVIVSLGTGTSERNYHCNTLKKWKDIQWIQPLINTLMGASNKATQHHLKHLLNSDPYFMDYMRFDVNISNEAATKMDNSSDSNMGKLKEYGESMTQRHSYPNNKTFKDLVDLIRNNSSIMSRKFNQF